MRGRSKGRCALAGLVIATLGCPSLAAAHLVTTGMGPDGRLAFLGVGGDIDGQANPALSAKAGQVVEIVLVNDDNILHNIAVPDFGVTSKDVAKKDEQAAA